MTPEGRVKKMVNKALDALGEDCYRFMPVQSGFGRVGLDYFNCIKGRFVAIETKAPGKTLTPLQETTKTEIERAGGIVLVVWDEGSMAIALKIILALEFAPNVALTRAYTDWVNNATTAQSEAYAEQLHRTVKPAQAPE
jgi:hypothetical protein